MNQCERQRCLERECLSIREENEEENHETVQRCNIRNKKACSELAYNLINLKDISESTVFVVFIHWSGTRHINWFSTETEDWMLYEYVKDNILRHMVKRDDFILHKISKGQKQALNAEASKQQKHLSRKDGRIVILIERIMKSK